MKAKEFKKDRLKISINFFKVFLKKEKKENKRRQKERRKDEVEEIDM